MAANKGNTDWKKRFQSGRKSRYTKEEFVEKCCDYFDKTSNEKIGIEKRRTGDRAFTEKTLYKRPFTVEGLCTYLGYKRNYLTEIEKYLQLNVDKGLEARERIESKIGDTLVVYTERDEGKIKEISKEYLDCLLEKTEEELKDNIIYPDYDLIRNDIYLIKRGIESEEYLDYVIRAREIIETEQLEGAIAGVYNQNIIARKLGIWSKEEEGERNINVKMNFERIGNNNAKFASSEDEIEE